MKYAVLIGDGMADYPVDGMDGKTPLQFARTPNMDSMALHGAGGRARNIPKTMPPGSDVAIMSIFGYDPKKYYTGRGPLEAASMGIRLGDGQIAFRCNLVTVSDGIMVDYSGGHMRTEEANIIIESLNKELGEKGLRFYTGVSYRNLLVVDQNFFPEGIDDLHCVPPHDILSEPVDVNLPRGAGSKVLNKLMRASQELLERHEVNKVRVDLNENPANMIWLWGQGGAPAMQGFTDKYGIRGGVISAVGLLKGLASFLDMDVIEVPGATGYYDTNYAGKAEHALKYLEKGDLVVVHVEAPDEAGHNGDRYEKLKAIESFDREIVGRVLAGLKKMGTCRVLVLPDHPTPLAKRTHVSDPVPFALYGEGVEPDKMAAFSEKDARRGKWKNVEGYALMDLLMQK